MHFYAWSNGLKTGMYYLRSRPAADAIKFTLDVEALLRDAGSIEVTKKNLKTVYNVPSSKSQSKGIKVNSQKSNKSSSNKENYANTQNLITIEEQA